MAGGTRYVNQVKIAGVAVGATEVDPDGLIQGQPTELLISKDPSQPGIFQCRGGDNWDVLVPRDDLVAGQVRDHLIDLGQSPASVGSNLLPRIYRNENQLPANPGVPVAWAIVWPPSQSMWSIAWFRNGGWQVEAYPWPEPPAVPLPAGARWVLSALNQVAEGQAGSAWQYSMGFQGYTTAAAVGKRILKLALKRGDGVVGLSARWALARSSVLGPSAPLESSYTTLQTGLHTFGANQSWEEVGGFTPVSITAENEWYRFVAWVGTGGQSQIITSARASGWVDETYLTVPANGGLFRLTPGVSPGPDPIPLTGYTATGNFYGLTTFAIGD